MKTFSSFFIGFVLKFIELISNLFKLRSDQSRALAPITTDVVSRNEPNGSTTDVDSRNAPDGCAYPLQPLAHTAEGRHPSTDVEANLMQSEATASAGEHSNVTRRVQLQVIAAGAPEEYGPEHLRTATRESQAPNDEVQLQWRLLIFGIYLTAVAIVLQALQIMKDIPAHKSLQFHYFRMALVFSIAYLTVSVYVRPYSEVAALMFEQVAVFFGAMALFLVITVADFPHAVLIISLVVFVVSLLIVFLATFLRC